LTYHNYARGSIDEYDAWEELGNTGWNWRSLYPYFTKTDDVTPGPVGFLPGVTQPPGLANAQAGAVGGPIKVCLSFFLILSFSLTLLSKGWIQWQQYLHHALHCRIPF
jgi:hypothetical protein